MPRDTICDFRGWFIVVESRDGLCDGSSRSCLYGFSWQVLKVNSWSNNTANGLPRRMIRQWGVDGDGKISRRDSLLGWILL